MARSYGSRPDRIGIDARNVSYILRLDDVWSSRIVRNVTRSSAQSVEGETATMDAALGALREGRGGGRHKDERKVSTLSLSAARGGGAASVGKARTRATRGAQ